MLPETLVWREKNDPLRRRLERTTIEKGLLRPRMTTDPSGPRSSSATASPPFGAGGGGTTKVCWQVSPSSGFFIFAAAATREGGLGVRGWSKGWGVGLGKRADRMLSMNNA